MHFSSEVLGVESDRDGRVLVLTAANEAENRLAAVHVLDQLGQEVALLELGTQPTVLAYDDVRNRAYVANRSDGYVTPLDIDDVAVGLPVQVATQPIDLAVDTLSGRVFVADHGADGMAYFDNPGQLVVLEGDLSVFAAVPMPRVTYVAVAPGGDTVYTSDQMTTSVHTAWGYAATEVEGAGGGVLDVSHDGGTLYVGRQDGHVAAVGIATGAVTTSPVLNGRVLGVADSADGRVLAAQPDQGKVSVLAAGDLSRTGVVGGLLPTSGIPSGPTHLHQAADDSATYVWGGEERTVLRRIADTAPAEPLPTVAAAASTVLEVNPETVDYGYYSYTVNTHQVFADVTLSAPSPDWVELTFEVVPSEPASALPGSDYREVDSSSPDGSVLIPPGATSARVGFLLQDDIEPEAVETAMLRITSAVGAAIGETAEITILDDDGSQGGAEPQPDVWAPTAREDFELLPRSSSSCPSPEDPYSTSEPLTNPYSTRTGLVLTQTTTCLQTAYGSGDNQLVLHAGGSIAFPALTDEAEILVAAGEAGTIELRVLIVNPDGSTYSYPSGSEMQLGQPALIRLPSGDGHIRSVEVIKGVTEFGPIAISAVEMVGPGAGDTIAPDIDFASPAEGAQILQGSALLLEFRCLDDIGGSGIRECGDGSSSGYLDTSAPGSYSVPISATDMAGNRTVESVNYTVVAVEQPAVTFDAPPTPGTRYAEGDSVAGSYACTGPVAFVRCVGYVIPSGGAAIPLASGDVLPTGNPGTYEIEVQGEDLDGNHVYGHTYYIVDPPPDQTPPSVTVAAPVDGQGYAVDEAVLAEWRCDDASGIQQCTGVSGAVGTAGEAILSGQLLNTSVAGDFFIRVTAQDAAGNLQDKTVSYTVVAPGDAKEVLDGSGATVTTGDVATLDTPVQTSITVPEGLTGTLTVDAAPTTSTSTGFALFGQTLEIHGPDATVDSPYTMSFTVDESQLNGVAPSDVQVFRNGEPLADCTDPVKAIPDPCIVSRDLTVAPDDGGDVVVTVRTSAFSFWTLGALDYDLTGPFQPVAANPKGNTFKAGSTVPVKFKLGGDRGLNVIADAYPQTKACQSGAARPAVGALSYDAKTDTYNYKWRTKNLNGCHQLTIRFRDGSELKVNATLR